MCLEIWLSSLLLCPNLLVEVEGSGRWVVPGEEPPAVRSETPLRGGKCAKREGKKPHNSTKKKGKEKKETAQYVPRNTPTSIVEWVGGSCKNPQYRDPMYVQPRAVRHGAAL